MSSVMEKETAAADESGTMKVESECFLIRLPDEMILEVLKYLPRFKIIHLGTMNRRFRRICRPLQFQILRLDFTMNEALHIENIPMFQMTTANKDEDSMKIIRGKVNAKEEKTKSRKSIIGHLKRPFRRVTESNESLADTADILKATTTSSAEMASGSIQESTTRSTGPSRRYTGPRKYHFLLPTTSRREWINSSSTYKWLEGFLHDTVHEKTPMLPFDIMPYIERLELVVPRNCPSEFLGLFMRHFSHEFLSNFKRLQEVVMENITVSNETCWAIGKFVENVGEWCLPLHLTLRCDEYSYFDAIFANVSRLQHLSVEWTGYVYSSSGFRVSSVERWLAAAISRSPNLETFILKSSKYPLSFSAEQILAWAQGEGPLAIKSLHIQKQWPPYTLETLGRLKNLQDIKAGFSTSEWQTCRTEWACMWRSLQHWGIRLRSISSPIRRGDEFFEYLSSYPKDNENGLQELSLYIDHMNSSDVQKHALKFWREILPSISASLTTLTLWPPDDAYASFRSTNHRKLKNQTEERGMESWSLLGIRDLLAASVSVSFPHLRNANLFAIHSLESKWYYYARCFASRCPMLYSIEIQLYLTCLKSETLFESILTEASAQASMQDITVSREVLCDVRGIFIKPSWSHHGLNSSEDTGCADSITKYLLFRPNMSEGSVNM